MNSQILKVLIYARWRSASAERHAAFAIYPYSLFCYVELEQKAWFWLSRLFHLNWYLLRLNYCSLIKFSKLYRAGGVERTAFLVVHVRHVASASASLLAFYKIIFALVVQGKAGHPGTPVLQVGEPVWRKHFVGERWKGGCVAPEDVHNLDLDLIGNYRGKAEVRFLLGHLEADFCFVFQSSKSYCHPSAKWKHKHQRHTSYTPIAILTISQKAVVLMVLSFWHKLPICLCTQVYSELKRYRDQENKTSYI